MKEHLNLILNNTNTGDPQGDTTAEEVRSFLSNLENKLPTENISTPVSEEIYDATLFYFQRGKAVTVRKLEYPKDKLLLTYLREQDKELLAYLNEHGIRWYYYTRKQEEKLIHEEELAIKEINPNDKITCIPAIFEN